MQVIGCTEPIEDARVGEPRNGQVHDRAHRRVHGKRLRQLARRRAQEAFVFLASLLTRDVAQNDREQEPVRRDELRNRRLGRKVGAIGTTSEDLSPFTHSPRGRGRPGEVLQVCLVRRAKARWKQDGQMAADRVAGAIAEDLFSPAVEMDDPLAVVDRDDRIGCDGQDAGKLGL